MEYGRTDEKWQARPPVFRDPSDDLVSPHPLDVPEEIDSRGISSTISSSSSQDESSLAPPPDAFLKLPPEVIERILYIVDADTFASAVLLTRKWYAASQKIELYAHHLSRCPSYALTNNVISGPFRKNDLIRLKTRFASEVRRNLFEAFLRPRDTLVNLICTSANSSAAFPGGEAFRFAFSPSGQTLLALSSSRIFVINLTLDHPSVTRELKTFRRPLSASITDDGSLLAVLSTKHQANIYGLTSAGVRHIQILILDNPPRTIALAHKGTVLAAAYEGGVEVFSLSANALSTDRRAVRCEAVDTLTFSGDGSMLVGSSHSPDDPNAVIITAPFYTENDPNLSDHDIHSRMWTTQILFPNNSSTCSHAALLPSHTEGDGNWIFAFDHTLRSFRAVRTDDTRTGVTYFLSPPISRRFSMPSPTLGPTATASGELVVAGFSGTGLWMYGVPEKVDTAPDMGSVIERDERRNHSRLPLTSATGNREPLMAYSPSLSGTTDSIEDDSLAGKVDWRQSLFVKCRHLKSISGLSAAQWVERPDTVDVFRGKRLAVVAPGGVSAFAEELGEEAVPVDGGRISILDFDYAPHEGGSQVLTIEVGQREPELLPEQHGNHDVEVALERRRTVRTTRGRGNRRLSLGRSATAIGSHSVDWPSNIDERLARNSISQPSSPVEGFNSPNGVDGQLAGSPLSPSRPPDGLQRAATAAAVSRARYPPRPPLSSGQGLSSGHVIYRRQDGRQIPHESDADNWEPPPPPYKRSPPGPTPVDFHPSPQPRHATDPIESVTERVSLPHRASTTMDGMMISDNAPTRRSMSQYGGLARMHRPHGMSESSLDTLAEMNNNHHEPPNTIISPIARGSSGDSITRVTAGESLSSPISANSAPYIPRRRPLSHDGRVTPEHSLPVAATISRSMITATPERTTGEMQTQSIPSGRFVPSRRPVPTIEEDNITLTGQNLQNRLNHPVPPTPTRLEQEITPTYIPQDLQIGNPPCPSILPSNRNSEPFTLAPPSADQMANLHRRVSSERHRSLSISTNGAYPAASAAQDHAVPPSPPLAAWGAAGVPGAVSFSKARNTPQGLFRSKSRGSQRSLGLSSSTPNLLAQRPPYGRLDTIESIDSAYGQQEHMHSRSHSMLQAMGLVDESAMDDEHRVVADPKALKKSQKKKRRVEQDYSDSLLDGRRKKQSKCIVM